MSQNVFASIEKLRGRENFDAWKFAMQAYLEHEELWECINGTKENDAKMSLKAKSKIILSIDPVIYPHVQTATTAKEAWDNLGKAFLDSGLGRKVSLLRSLINTKMRECASIEEYVNKIISTAHKLTGIGLNVDETWVGCLMLAGLPDDYKPMIMAIENSGSSITGDAIKTILMQEEMNGSKSEGAAAMMMKKSNKNRSIKCYGCHKKGHYSSECPNRKQHDTTTSSKTTHKAVFSSFLGEVRPMEWYIDSGASAHMVKQRELFNDITSTSVNSEVITANDLRLKVQAVGNVNVMVKDGDSVDQVQVKDALHVPDLCANLLSVSQMVKNGNHVSFDQRGCTVYNDSNEVVLTARQQNGMYILDRATNFSMVAHNSALNSEFYLWHRRMGHLNFESVSKLKSKCAEGVNFDENKREDCVTCAKGKQTRLPFKDVATRATECLEIVHSDVCGPIEVNSIGGARYIFVLVDDFTRKVFVYAMKSKSEVAQIFIEFKNMVENQINKKIKILRTDNGTEYVNEPLKKFLRNSGIRHQLTAPYTPEQNGVAERMNRTIIERARCMLIDAKLEKEFWGEAVCTATYIINRSPCRMLKDGITPEAAWTGKTPNLKNLRVFGCACQVHIPKQKRRKFDVKSDSCIFLGYCSDSKAYRVWNPMKKQVQISRDVIFYENMNFSQDSVNIKSNSPNVYFDLSTEFDSVGDIEIREEPRRVEEFVVTDDEIREESETEFTDNVSITPESAPSNSSPLVQSESDTLNDSSSSESNSDLNDYVSSDNYETVIESSDDDFQPPSNLSMHDVPQIRKSSRPPKPVKLSDDFISFGAKCSELDDPITIEDALNRTDRQSWKKAMESEMNSLSENNTWELVELPPDRKPIKCKWVFKTKKDASGNIDRYKARLVVKGCSQRKGLDYDETYSPVVRYSSVRFLLAMAVKFDLEIHQMDAVTAFLQGDLTEEIYMEQPDGFAEGSNKVCHLKKSLYGLKQASRIWNAKLDAALLKYGLTRSKYDPCIYYNVQDSEMMFVAVYVDDLLIFCNNNNSIDHLKGELSGTFKMKDLGNARFVLGMNITRDRKQGKLWIDQEHYINEMLLKFNLSDCNPVATPIDCNQKLSNEMCPQSEEDHKDIKMVPYQQAVGSILFAAQISRPDICCAVNFLVHCKIIFLVHCKIIY